MTEPVARLGVLTMQLLARMEALELFIVSLTGEVEHWEDRYRCAECDCELPSWNPDLPRDAAFLENADHDEVCVAAKAMRVLIEAPKVDS